MPLNALNLAAWKSFHPNEQILCAKFVSGLWSLVAMAIYADGYRMTREFAEHVVARYQSGMLAALILAWLHCTGAMICAILAMFL